MPLFKILLLVMVIALCNISEAESIAVMSVDLGSEWIKIAIVKPGVPMEIALNKESRRKTPFVVSMKGNERYFGDPALGVAVKQPPKAYIYLTHLLGKQYDSAAVQLYKERFPYYTLLKDEERGTVLFQGENDEKHSVEELIAMMLNNTRHIAENFADHPMKDVVLTVPVFFSQAERKALINAANMTRLNVLQLMNDNTAVALNYGIFRAATFNATIKHIMFYDMGSSHTTVTIVGYSTTKVKDRGYLETVPQLVIKGVGFDNSLGGLEMDMRMRSRLVKAFKAKHKTKNEITENPRAMAKMLKEAKRVRQVLSANTDHMAQIENVFEEKDFKLKVTRAELEEMCKDLVERANKPVKMALDAAAMILDDIETVILMGGASRIPKVQEKLMEATKKQELGKNINTDEAAALGAVYKAADLTAGFKVKRFIVKDLNLFPLDVQFERTSTTDDTTSTKVINRNLYHRLNPIPQKKIMTFNKKPNDFHFNVSYGDLTFMTADVNRSFDLGHLFHIKLSGVDTAHEKNAKANTKGVKAYFNLDESGILHVEKIEAHFEKSPELIIEEEQSTFAKLGSKLSSFFGSSKNDDETVETPKEETKPDESTKEPTIKETKKEEKDSENKTEESMKENTTATNNATVGNATDKAGNNKTEEKPTKPVLVKEDITFKLSYLDLPSIPQSNFETSSKKLHNLEARDQAKVATEMARNSLESYIFEFKDKLYQDDAQKLSSEEERTKIENALSDGSNWLDEEGFDADEQTLKKKFKTLKETSQDLQFRLDEMSERPKAIASMLQSLNLTNVFFASIKAMSDSKEIYTEKDLKDLEKVYDEGKEWLMTNWKKQNESDPTKKPIFLTKDIVYQQGKVDRELMYLINKAKYYVPKPKSKPNSTAANTTKTKDVNATKTGTASSNETEKAEKKDDSTKKTEKKDDNSKAEKVEDENETAEKENEAEEKAEEKPLELDGGNKTVNSSSSQEESNNTKTNSEGEHHVPEDEL